MDITGTQSIPASRQRVWDALNDPDILRRCLPGCESVVRSASGHFDVVMLSAIGPLRARFTGRLTLSDVQEPSACTLIFEGQGGAIGFGKGSATVQLADAPGGTELRYDAQAQVGGKLAQVGSRLIESVARKMASSFFESFKAQLAPTVAPAPPDPTPAPATESMATTTASGMADNTPAGASAGVPGWWLLVAAAMGSLATLAGMALAR